MERTAYNLLRDRMKENHVVRILQERYKVANWRWCESAVNQAEEVYKSQQEVLRYRIELYKEKIRNTKLKLEHLSNALKIGGCKTKIAKLESSLHDVTDQLENKSFPSAVFGSKALFQRLAASSKGGVRQRKLREEWKERRSNHFFCIGHVRQKGNGNTRLSCDTEGRFYLEIRNWPPEDFKLGLIVPLRYREVIQRVIEEAGSGGQRNPKPSGGGKGLTYSIRLLRSPSGYQVLVSFELEEGPFFWTERVAGLDMNPEGIACTIASKDGNLIATRFFKDNRLISSSSNKRKWVLENLINKILRWCKCTHSCNAVAVERLRLRGAYDYGSVTNMKLSNFMRRKMVQTVRIHALRMNMVSVEVNPAYTTKVAEAKYCSKQFGGFNGHQLAAFVIARRVLGYGEVPSSVCLPKTKKQKMMWNYCIRYYGYSPQSQTLLQHEPMEWKSVEDVNGGGGITELPKARPANTSSRGLSQYVPACSRTGAVQTIEVPSRRAGSVHPNPHAKEGDGARGDRADLPPLRRHLSSAPIDSEDTRYEELL